MRNTTIANNVKVKNGFSVDFEDGFSCLRKVEENTLQLIELLSVYQVKATFFCVASLAAKLPILVRRIFNKGHEIALHGLYHESIKKMSPKTFYDSISIGKDILEQIISSPIFGYRAPYLSLEPDNTLFIDILKDSGIIYDSSLPSFASYFKNKIIKKISVFHNGLIEVPISSAEIHNILLHPIGGGYLKHLPLFWIKFCLNRIEKSGNPLILYCHPYEIDPFLPTFSKNESLSLPSLVWCIKHYHNCGKKLCLKLIKILKNRLFFPLINVMNHYKKDMMPLIY